MLNYSILDLAPVCTGKTPSDTFKNSADLAGHAERLGYKRYWLAEHHNMPGIASSATSVLIGFIASQTQSIRVGAGGIMLPNHSPLVIAEQFGTLASLYPNRIDLALGRVFALRPPLGGRGTGGPALAQSQGGAGPGAHLPQVSGQKPG